MTYDQILAMLQCQDRLNIAVIGPDWHNSSLNFSLAGAQECSEGIDYLSWKWWKKSTPNLEAAKMEVVDLLHFHLSNMLQEICIGDVDEIVDKSIREACDRYLPYTRGECVYPVNSASAIQLFQLLQNEFYHDSVNFGHILLAFERLGGNDEELIRLYYQKAVLNRFRANNGYKTGEYIKEWAFGREDNDFIPALSEGIDFALPNADPALYNRLAEKYHAVKVGLTH
jgi:dimeric dUTPase (all-alpha-NTP-PPase superfamily)